MKIITLSEVKIENIHANTISKMLVCKFFFYRWVKKRDELPNELVSSKIMNIFGLN